LLKEQYDLLENEYNEVNQSLDSKTVKYEEKLKKLLNENNNLAKKVEELEIESMEWEKSYDNLDEKYTEVVQESDLLKKQIETYEKELNESEKEKSPKRASSTNKLDEKLKKALNGNYLLF
jgi:chromosome segregation ATPase